MLQEVNAENERVNLMKLRLEEEIKALKVSREKSEEATGKFNLLSDKMKAKLEKEKW